MSISYSPKEVIGALIAAFVRGICMHNGMDATSSEVISSIANGMVSGILIEKAESVFSEVEDTIKRCFISTCQENEVKYSKKKLRAFLESFSSIEMLEVYLHDDINMLSDRLSNIVDVSDKERIYIAEDFLRKVAIEIQDHSSLLALDTNYIVHELLSQYRSQKSRHVMIRKQAEFLHEPIYGNPDHTLQKLFVEYQIEYRYKDCRKTYDSCWSFFDCYQYFGPNRLLLMLGDYGAGKSSTLKLLASRNQTSQYVYIPLRDVLLFSSNIRDGIIEYCQRKYQYCDIFSQSVKHILLLDGFDELQQIMAERNEVKYFRQIRSLLDYENISIVLSSRGTRFVQNINITLYPQIYLSDFKEEQINSWIQKWNAANDSKSIISFEGIKERDLLYVASNKLILYMIARIYDEELVEARRYTRGYIYRLFIDWTISGKFKDDQTQHIMPSLQEQERYRQILQEIAYVMTVRGEEIITYEELSAALDAFQKTELYAVLYDVNVQIFTQHFFTISHDDYNCISFSHKSFRQYLLAEKLWKLWDGLENGTENYGIWYQFGKYKLFEKESFDFLNDFFTEETDIKKLQRINQGALKRCALFVNSDQYTKLLLENQHSKILEAAECYSRSIILSNIAGIVNVLTANRLAMLGKKYRQISTENIFMLCDYYLREKNTYPINNYDLMAQYIKQIRIQDMQAFRSRYYYMDLQLFKIQDSFFSTALFFSFRSRCTDMVNVHWEFSKMYNCTIANGSMKSVSFKHCILENVTFNNVTFDSVVFNFTENSNVIFQKCSFIGCYFENCIIENIAESNSDKIVSKDFENVKIELLALDNLDAS